MEKTREIIMIGNEVYGKVNKDKIIVIGKDVYEKANNDNGVWIIPNMKKNQNKNETETSVDGIGRVQLAKSVMKKIGIKSGDKLEEYVSGRNIVLKKLTPKKDISRETSMIVDNRYEVKMQISNLDFNTKHRITTVDEFGNVLIWNEIREDVGIIEKDKLKVCVKEDAIILIKKGQDDNNRRKSNFNNNRRKRNK